MHQCLPQTGLLVYGLCSSRTDFCASATCIFLTDQRVRACARAHDRAVPSGIGTNRITWYIVLTSRVSYNSTYTLHSTSRESAVSRLKAEGIVSRKEPGM